MRTTRLQNWCCAVAVLIPAVVWAASPASNTKTTPVTKTVELFAGIEAGEIEATVIMSDSTKGTVMVANKTEQPLTIKLPAAFAGVPILAQRGGRGGGMGGGMGGMGGMGGGMGGMGGMGGF